jgi:hypothetical protein
MKIWAVDTSSKVKVEPVTEGCLIVVRVMRSLAIFKLNVTKVLARLIIISTTKVKVTLELRYP